VGYASYTQDDDSDIADDEIDGDCRTPGCFLGQVTSEEDNTDKPDLFDEIGDCKKAECEEGIPSLLADDGDEPVGDDIPHDCQSPTGCMEGNIVYEDDNYDKPLDSTPVFDCFVSDCVDGSPEPVYDPTDVIDQFCSECTPTEIIKLTDGEPCDDGTVDVPGDCNTPGCFNGFCFSQGNPNPSDKPDDPDPFDCVVPDCNGGVIIENLLDNIIGPDGKCLFCSGAGPEDQCQEIFDMRSAEIIARLTGKIAECHSPSAKVGARTARTALTGTVLSLAYGFICVGNEAEQSADEKRDLDALLNDCHENCQLF